MRARRIARWFAVAVCAVLALVFAAIAVVVATLDTDWGRGQVKVAVENQLDDLFRGGAHVGKVEGSPLGTLVLDDVVIDAPDGTPAITIDSLELDVALWPLVSHEVHIDRAVARGVTVNIVKDRAGVDLATLTRPSDQPSTWDVVIDELIAQGAVSYVDRTSGQTVHLDAIGVVGGFDVPARGDARAHLAVSGLWREQGTGFDGAVDLVKGDEATTLRYARARLGGAQVITGVTTIRGDAIDGEAWLDALPGGPARLPVPLHLHVQAAGAAGLETVALDGALGRSPVRGQLAIARDPLHARGGLAIQDADAAVLAPGAPRSRLDAELRIDLIQDAALAGVAAWRGSAGVDARGSVEGAPVHELAIDADLRGGAATVLAAVRGEGAAALHLDAALHGLGGDELVLDDARVIAAAPDLATAAGPDLAVSGSLWLDLHARGRAGGPIAVRGAIDGRKLSNGSAYLGRLHVDLDGAGMPAAPTGVARVVAKDVRAAGHRLGALMLDATARPDHAIALVVKSEPPTSPWMIDLDALLRYDAGREVATIALGAHKVRTRGVAWVGSGGLITIDPRQVAVRDLRTRIAGGTVGLDARYRLGGGDLTAIASVDHLDLHEVDRSLGLGGLWLGQLDGRAEIGRRRDRWTGALDLSEAAW